ncbi:hypothetical protein DPMN_094943 [Dreissena polymorpha]|uniref:Uncharacterized protein n=1 Tax=Dreissena polymorpha TaxID=45954 RepID=A0A9D4R2E1_DREPO|nr:hypothetical protein DPMN_094943 [Dreissena polymorpha]
MSYTLYLTLLNVCLHLGTSSSDGFNVTEIAIMTFLQSKMCDNYKTCGKVIEETNETNSEHVEAFVNDLQFTWPKLPPTGCCQECSCDIATCVIMGTCCPDILDQVNLSGKYYML